MADTGYRSRARDVVPRWRTIPLLCMLPVVFVLGRCSGPASTLVSDAGPAVPTPAAAAAKLVRFDDAGASCWVALDADDQPVAVTCLPSLLPDPTHAMTRAPSSLYARVTP